VLLRARSGGTIASKGWVWRRTGGGRGLRLGSSYRRGRGRPRAATSCETTACGWRVSRCRSWSATSPRVGVARRFSAVLQRPAAGQRPAGLALDRARWLPRERHRRLAQRGRRSRAMAADACCGHRRPLDRSWQRAHAHRHGNPRASLQPRRPYGHHADGSSCCCRGSLAGALRACIASRSPSYERCRMRLWRVTAGDEDADAPDADAIAYRLTPGATALAWLERRSAVRRSARGADPARPASGSPIVAKARASAIASSTVTS
jgi:hypothetical protein